MSTPNTLKLGAHPHAGAYRFVVWAPNAKAVELVLFADATTETERLQMTPGERGYFELVADAPTGLYKFALDDKGVFPDPASRHQPFGVHGPSRCVELPPARMTSLPARDQVIYELHVGTMTEDGTLASLVAELPRLRDLGVTMLDLMPLAQTPGGRNWGYDGVYPFSVADRYGGPRALFDFVQQAHAHGLGVMLDVVYNHLGPEGNYLPVFGPYFNPNVHTPWGPALNFEAQHSDEVRRFFIESAVQWITDYDVDGLRLDAVHEIQDRRPVTFLAELNDAVHGLGKSVTVLAESDMNDPRYVTPTEALGHGCDMMYSEDLHHALHAALTGETRGYYEDFADLEHLARAMRSGASYDGQYAKTRKRRHGRSVAKVDPRRLLVFSQNHDQIGNRAVGDRLTTIVGVEAQSAAAVVVLASPYTPFLFMGEEYGETAPFQYFVEHGDPELVAAVRKGRREEFSGFGWDVEVPDPQAESTFTRSRINPKRAAEPAHAAVLKLYKELIALRREVAGPVDEATIVPTTRVLRFTREGGRMAVFVNLSRESVTFDPQVSGAYALRVATHEAPTKLDRGVRVTLPAFGGSVYMRKA